MSNIEMTFVATCMFGLEKLVGEEIDALGYKRLETIDGRVYFTAPIDAVARCNLWFRYAERLMIVLGRFRASTFDELFEGTKAIPWDNFIGAQDAFPVKGHSIKSKLFSIPDCQKIVKKAIVERMRRRYGVARFDETGVKYQVEFFILNDEAALMIDTSGTSLHKRGYRPEAGIAPLRETLAAALVAISRPRENVLLWDPFCGSGTIPIEAALIMTNTAPGLFRTFAAEKFGFVSTALWKNSRDEARSLINNDTAFEAFASDIDPECCAIANENIRRAGMEKHVKAFVRDALTIEASERRGTIVCNPPYGERMFTEDQTAQLYRRMGEHFATLDPWQIYIISSRDDFEELYGRKADKIKRMYNGMLKCSYYQFFKRQSNKM